MVRPRICVIGSLNMDLVVQTPALPQPGETILGGPFSTFLGGKGANQAVAAARAGAAVTMIGCVGDDGYGDRLCQGLVAEGIDVSQVLVRKHTASGVALIAVAPDGQNTIIVASGANATLTPEAVRSRAGIIAAADVLLLQLEVPLDAIEEAVRVAGEAGRRVILNPAPAQTLTPSLLAGISIIVPNETETSLLTGRLPVDWDSAEVAARLLCDQGVGAAVVTLGSRGALYVDRSERCLQPAYQIEAVDATAAGDAFVGAFSVALAEGMAPAQALAWGCAAGALATTRPGAQPSLPSRAAITRLVEGVDGAAARRRQSQRKP